MITYLTQVCRLGGHTVCLSRFFLAAYCCFICLFVWFFNHFGFFLPVTCQSSILLFLNYSTWCWILYLFYLCFLLSLCVVLPLHLLFLPLTSLFEKLSIFHFFPFLSSSLHLLLFFLSPPRVTLDPSKRQSSNKSMSGCTLPQGTKTVSKSSFPMFSGCFCPSDCLSACQCSVIPSTPHLLSVAGQSLVIQTFIWGKATLKVVIKSITGSN